MPENSLPPDDPVEVTPLADYYDLRAERERGKAASAPKPSIRDAHLELARIFDQLAVENRSGPSPIG